jgi:hypothetical protein
VHTCHTADSVSSSPSRSSSLVEGALASLGMALQQGALLPVGPMAMDVSPTTAIIELTAKLVPSWAPCPLERRASRLTKYFRSQASGRSASTVVKIR